MKLLSIIINGPLYYSDEAKRMIDNIPVDILPNSFQYDKTKIAKTFKTLGKESSRGLF